MRLTVIILLTLFLSGCSGEYILTAPDVVCPAGEKAALIFRLQRREFWKITPPKKNATVMVHLPDGTVRCALTDENGYAAIAFIVPSRCGVYQVRFYYQDVEGQELSAKGNVYSLSMDDRFVVVDMDSLPRSGTDLSSACLALKRLSQNAQLIYVSEKLGYTPATARGLLRIRGYPKGQWCTSTRFHDGINTVYLARAGVYEQSNQQELMIILPIYIIDWRNPHMQSQLTTLLPGHSSISA